MYNIEFTTSTASANITKLINKVEKLGAVTDAVDGRKVHLKTATSASDLISLQRELKKTFGQQTSTLVSALNKHIESSTASTNKMTAAVKKLGSDMKAASEVAGKEEKKRATAKEKAEKESSKQTVRIFKAALSELERDNRASLRKRQSDEIRIAKETQKKVEAVSAARIRQAVRFTTNTDDGYVKATGQLKQYYTELSRTSAAEEKAKAAKKSLITQMHSGAQATAGLRAALSAAGTNIGMFTSQTIIAAAAVYGMTAALKQSMVVGVEFTDMMARVQAVTGASAEKAEEMSRFVREFASTTIFTAREGADALLQLGMAGLTADEAMQALPATLGLASIGVMDAGQAADIATNVMTQFGLSATEITMVVDDLATAANSSNTTVKQLGDALTYVGPVASAAGVPLETITASIQMMANAGIKGSRAGTGLRRIISNLSAPTKKATETLASLGIATMDATGRLKPLEVLIKQLQDANIGVAEATRLVGVRQVQSLLALTNSQDSLEELRNELGRNEGAAKDFQRTIEDTMGADLRLMVSALEEKFLQFFDSNEDGLRQAIQTTTEWIKAFDVEKVNEALSVMGEVAQIALAVFVGSAAMRVGKWLFGVNTAATTAAEGVGSLSGAFSKLTKVVSGAMLLIKANPWVAAITSLAAAGTYLYTEFMSVTEETEKLTTATSTLSDKYEDAAEALDKEAEARKKSNDEMEREATLADQLNTARKDASTVASKIKSTEAEISVREQDLAVKQHQEDGKLISFWSGEEEQAEIDRQKEALNALYKEYAAINAVIGDLESKSHNLMMFVKDGTGSLDLLPKQLKDATVQGESLQDVLAEINKQAANETALKPGQLVSTAKAQMDTLISASDELFSKEERNADQIRQFSAEREMFINNYRDSIDIIYKGKDGALTVLDQQISSMESQMAGLDGKVYDNLKKDLLNLKKERIETQRAYETAVEKSNKMILDNQKKTNNQINSWEKKKVAEQKAAIKEMVSGFDKLTTASENATKTQLKQASDIKAKSEEQVRINKDLAESGFVTARTISANTKAETDALRAKAKLKMIQAEELTQMQMKLGLSGEVLVASNNTVDALRREADAYLVLAGAKTTAERARPESLNSINVKSDGAGGFSVWGKSDIQNQVTALRKAADEAAGHYNDQMDKAGNTVERSLIYAQSQAVAKYYQDLERTTYLSTYVGLVDGMADALRDGDTSGMWSSFGSILSQGFADAAAWLAQPGNEGKTVFGMSGDQLSEAGQWAGAATGIIGGVVGREQAGDSKGAAGAAVGGAIGSIWGPAAAQIGSAIGGMLLSETEKVVGEGFDFEFLNGALDEAFSTIEIEKTTMFGSWTEKKKTALSEDAMGVIGRSFDDISLTMKEQASFLGTELDDYSGTVSLKNGSMADALEVAKEQYADAAFAALESYARVGETAYDTFSRVAEQSKLIDDALSGVGVDTLDVSHQFVNEQAGILTEKYEEVLGAATARFDVATLVRDYAAGIDFGGQGEQDDASKAFGPGFEGIMQEFTATVTESLRKTGATINDAVVTHLVDGITHDIFEVGKISTEFTTAGRATTAVRKLDDAIGELGDNDTDDIVDDIEEAQTRLEGVFMEARVMFNEAIMGATSDIMGVTSDQAPAEFARLFQSYRENFRTETERMGTDVENAKRRLEDFSEIGVTTETSTEQLRDAIEAFQESDAFSPEGLVQYYAAADALIQFKNAVDAVKNSADSRRKEYLLNVNNDLYDSVVEKDFAEEEVRTFGDIYEYLLELQGLDFDGKIPSLEEFDDVLTTVFKQLDNEQINRAYDAADALANFWDAVDGQKGSIESFLLSGGAPGQDQGTTIMNNLGYLKEDITTAQDAHDVAKGQKEDLEGHVGSFTAAKDYWGTDEIPTLEEFYEEEAIFTSENDLLPETESYLEQYGEALEDYWAASDNFDATEKDVSDATEIYDTAISIANPILDNIAAKNKAKSEEEEYNSKIGLLKTLFKLREDEESLRSIDLADLEGGMEAVQALNFEEMTWTAVELQEAIWELEDSNAILQEKQQLERELLVLNEDTVAIRELELEAIHEENRALQESVWAREDELEAIEKARGAMDDRLSALKRAITEEKKTLKEKYDEDKKALKEKYDTEAEAQQTYIEGLRDSVNELGPIISAIKSAMSGLRVESESLDESRRKSALAQLSEAARTGTVLDQETVSRLGGEINREARGEYTDYNDYVRDQVQAREDWQILLAKTEGQLTTEEEILRVEEEAFEQDRQAYEDELKVLTDTYDTDVKALDETLKHYEDQINILNGIDVSVQSVEQAIKDLDAAIKTFQHKAPPVVHKETQEHNGGFTTTTQEWSDGTTTSETAYNGHYTPGETVLQMAEEYGVEVASPETIKNMSVEDIQALAANKAVASNMHNDFYQAVADTNFFMNGGDNEGGWSVTGEAGMELQYTGPSKILSHSQTKSAINTEAVRLAVVDMHNDLAAKISKATNIHIESRDYLDEMNEVGIRSRT